MNFSRKQKNGVAVASATVLVTVSAFALAGIANGNPSQGEKPPTTHPIRLATAATSTTPPTPADIVAQLDEVVPGGVTDGGKRLIDAPTRHLDVVQSNSKGLCMVYSQSDTIASSGCFDGVTSLNAGVGYYYESDKPLEVFGVVDDAVDSVSVTAATGREYEVDVTNGAFIWIAPDASILVDSVSTTTDGRREVERHLFASLATDIAENES